MARWLDLIFELLLGTKPGTPITDGMVITENTTLQPGVHYLPNGIKIAAPGITLDGNGATIIGRNREGRGIIVDGQDGVTIKNLRVRDYYHGVYASRCKQLTINDCQITSTAELGSNTVFLDIWLPVERAYGSGILLSEVENSTINKNDLQHQMNGLLTYNCNRLTVRGNVTSYASGFGIHLYNTNDSLFEENFADYCCRWHPRGERTGYMGADATGFLVVYGSSRNVFRRNYARLGGDGFFLAGLSPRYEFKPCNNNLFEENDASYCPNNGFETTFCQENTYRKNIANFCNHGFWLGFSSTFTLEDNQMNTCYRAGIAVENGFDFAVKGNSFANSPHGILLWSKHIPNFSNVVPKNDTSYNWTIERNTFTRNGKGIRIASNQDHGVRPYAPGGPLPHDHTIRNNTINDNRIGIELVSVEKTLMDNNTFAGNVEGDVRE
jgi:parallel beta-helix repeat protein